MDKHQPILRGLQESDPEIADRLSMQAVSRRSAFKTGAAASLSLGTIIAAGSAPVALAAFASEAFGQARLPTVVVNVLKFALVLEELESRFYIAGVNSGVIPAADLPIFTTIRDHEIAHVQYLRNALGAQAGAAPTFDFTAGNGSGSGPYADVFTNYETFKAVAQAFEDTGVRAYKGQAPALKPYKDVLTAALTIHSVEARHASEVRRLRGNFQDTEPFYQGWINESATDVPGASAVYAGENNTVHLGIDVAALAYPFAIAHDEITEAFDEPLTQAQVLAIVDPFIV
jgi:hypothetical protein